MTAGAATWLVSAAVVVCVLGLLCLIVAVALGILGTHEDSP